MPPVSPSTDLSVTEIIPIPELAELTFIDWVIIPSALIVVFAVSKLVTMIIRPILHRIAKATSNPLDNTLIDPTLRPLEFLIGVFFLSQASKFIEILKGRDEMISVLVHTLTISGLMWLFFRATDAIVNKKIRDLQRKRQKAAANVMPLVRRGVKFIVFMIFGIMFLQGVGIDVAALVAGLGIGGLALALAGQKTIENLFGGIVLVIDQPAKVGEVLQIGPEIRGKVEDIGVRSTRIRTLEDTIITIPNAELSQMQIENLSRRKRMLVKTILGLRYESSPDQLRYVLVEIKKMIHAHPKVDETPVRVRFVHFGAYSLDIEVFCYAKTSSWSEFFAIREDIYLRIMDIISSSGTGFAFPSQTIYREEGTGLDKTKTEASEKKVQNWRKKGELLVPSIPDEMKEEIRGTLEYPPKGSIVYEEKD